MLANTFLFPLTGSPAAVSPDVAFSLEFTGEAGCGFLSFTCGVPPSSNGCSFLSSPSFLVAALPEVDCPLCATGGTVTGDPLFVPNMDVQRLVTLI